MNRPVKSRECSVALSGSHASCCKRLMPRKISVPATQLGSVNARKVAGRRTNATSASVYTNQRSRERWRSSITGKRGASTAARPCAIRTGVTNAGGGWGGMRLLRYAVVAPVRMAQGRAAVDAPRLPVMLGRQRSRERWFVYTLALVAFVLRPATFLAFTLPSWVAGTLSFLGINLLQHDACDPDRATEQSRAITGRFIDFLFFNGGYHTLHHDRPGLHWSRLPAEHRRIVPDREEA